MASVFKRPKSRYWHAGWRDAAGRFFLRSTKQVDRSKALTVALEWERVDKKLARGEMVENQVRQVINDILEKVGESVIDVPTTRHWFKEWMGDKEASKAETTAERYQTVVDNFLEHLANVRIGR